MFYWSLLNIYPQYRSSHRAYNLLAITTSENLKRFGPTPILDDFITTMKQLGSPEGLVLKVANQERAFHGLLAFVAGDTPASALLGGFKESVGGAFRPCRRCLISREDVKIVFDYESFRLRNADLHAEHLRTIFNEEITPRAKIFWSKEYGIKSKSCVQEIVDVTKCLPHDPMHVLLEGVLSSHITEFIKHCVNEGLFTLEEFNTSRANFDYECFVKDKPSKIDPAHLENGIRQSAAQMLALGQTLPFIVGGYLDESVTDHLNAFVLLMQIVNVCLAFELREDDADILTLMIRCHHTRFKALYGDKAITPKWHYLLHLGEQLVLFGPPRQHWSIRLEALHSYFKNIARRLRNFRNLIFSLANRKQNQQCVNFKSVPFLYHGDKITGKSCQILRNYVHNDLVHQVSPDIPEDGEIVCAVSIEFMGFTYKKGSGILIELAHDDLPTFGEIVELVVWDQNVIIIFSAFETSIYESRLNAYEVEAPEPTVYNALTINNLPSKHPLPIFKYDSKEYVILTYHRRTEFPD